MNFTVDAFLARVDQIGTTFVQNAYQQLAQALTAAAEVVAASMLRRSSSRST